MLEKRHLLRYTSLPKPSVTKDRFPKLHAAVSFLALDFQILLADTSSCQTLLLSCERCCCCCKMVS